MTQRARVLIIAGSDSGGGAGLQADLKAVMANGAYGMTAVTAVTAQNTLGVQGVWPVATDAVAAQLRACLSDIGADAIKTGMLASPDLIERVAELLDELASGCRRIIDPVMVATSGDRLVSEAAIGALTSELLPGADLITPNVHEAEILARVAVESLDGQRRAADRLLNKGARGALVKGGHIPGDTLYDVLQTHDGEWIFESPRIDTPHTHGTGCTLASAIAAHIARDRAMPEAVDRARAYLHRAIAEAPGHGAGHGPVDHGWALPAD